MKRYFILVCLLIQTMSSHSTVDDKELSLSTPAEMKDMLGVPPEKNVKNWMKLEVIGPVNSPPPVIWISSYDFSRSPPNYLIKLRIFEFQKYSEYIEKNSRFIRKNIYTKNNDLLVAQYKDEKYTEFGVIPQAEVCDFLSEGITSLNVTLSSVNSAKFDMLKAVYGCEQLK